MKNENNLYTMMKHSHNMKQWQLFLKHDSEPAVMFKEPVRDDLSFVMWCFILLEANGKLLS